LLHYAIFVHFVAADDFHGKLTLRLVSGSARRYTCLGCSIWGVQKLIFNPADAHTRDARHWTMSDFTPRQLVYVH